MKKNNKEEGIIMPHKTKLIVPNDPYEFHKSKNKGLGDLVEKIAQPIAKAIDKIAGTKIQKCGGCKKRKKYLNKIKIK